MGSRVPWRSWSAMIHTDQWQADLCGAITTNHATSGPYHATWRCCVEVSEDPLQPRADLNVYSRLSKAHRKKLHRDTLCSGMMCFSASGTVALGL